METKKVIEQKKHHSVEVIFHKSENRIVLKQDKSGIESAYIGIEKPKATEVAKAIDPKYQEVIDALNTLVQLKDIKDIPEMAEHYKTMKPKAWQQAIKILKELNV